MDLEQLEGAAHRLLDSVNVMTLATCGDDGPWAADVYFAREGWTLVFYSSPRSRHCTHLASSSACAVTVHADAPSWRDIRGLQMAGHATPADDSAATAYLQRFPFAAALVSTSVAPWLFRPTLVKYVDNTNGLGQAWEVDMADGRPLGVPRRA